jgi:hypothetical protein
MKHRDVTRIIFRDGPGAIQRSNSTDYIPISQITQNTPEIALPVVCRIPPTLIGKELKVPRIQKLDVVENLDGKGRFHGGEIIADLNAADSFLVFGRLGIEDFEEKIAIVVKSPRENPR